MKVNDIDFGNMRPNEIVDFHTIMLNLIGNHFTKSCADYIKKHLDAITIIDFKGDSNI